MIWISVIVVVNVIVTMSDPTGAQNSRAVSDIVEELLKSPGYNSRTRPATDAPLDVFININVNDISSISEVLMDYSMTMYLRQVWVDDRLAYTNYNKSITLNHNQFERLWTPDVFIRNLKSGVFHTITVPNRMIRIFPSGRVLYSQRLSLTLACEMQLDSYPMDNQTCHIEFGSYAYTTEDLVFDWRNDATPVEMNPGIYKSLPEYVITNVSHIVCSSKFSSTGSFPCLKASFHLERRLRAYILTTYLPSFLVVLLSWLSFWIDLESAPARTSLSILTILTITTQSSGLLRSMPAGSITKAIDVWMATCLVFVFGAFIEYSVVNTLARRQKAAAAKLKKITAEESLPTIRPNGWQQQQPPLQQQLHDLQGSSHAPHTPPNYSEYRRFGPPTDKALISPLSPSYPCSLQGGPMLTSRGGGDRGGSGSLTGGGSIKMAPGSARCSVLPGGSVGGGVDMERGSWWTELTSNKAVMVETISRALFPAMFLVFNLVYWPMYLL